eukprot:scaffold8548_cov39-Phaeocystis_antarctica.AAC.2
MATAVAAMAAGAAATAAGRLQSPESGRDRSTGRPFRRRQGRSNGTPPGSGRWCRTGLRWPPSYLRPPRRTPAPKRTGRRRRGQGWSAGWRTPEKCRAERCSVAARAARAASAAAAAATAAGAAAVAATAATAATRAAARLQSPESGRDRSTGCPHRHHRGRSNGIAASCRDRTVRLGSGRCCRTGLRWPPSYLRPPRRTPAPKRTGRCRRGQGWSAGWRTPERYRAERCSVAARAARAARAAAAAATAAGAAVVASTAAGAATMAARVAGVGEAQQYRHTAS